MLFGLKRKSLVPLPSANAPTRTSIVRLGRGTVAMVFVMVVVEKEVGFVGVLELDVLTIFSHRSYRDRSRGFYCCDDRSLRGRIGT